jgi:porin
MLFAGFFAAAAFGETPDHVISGNPAAVNTDPGTGDVGKWLGLPDDWGVRVGGIWLGDFNVLMSGGEKPGSVTWQSMLLVGVDVDAKKLFGWEGGTIGAQFLRYDGQDINGDAGTVQGYNGLQSSSPLRRSELYELWVWQKLFDDRVQIRIGKQAPTLSFTNVLKPIPVAAEGLAVPAISGLLYTPMFVNESQLGVIPGYYNSAWGITVAVEPTKRLSLTYGIYDGSGARGVQTGIDFGPTFAGAYFQIAEADVTWSLAGHLGRVGVGGWLQSGELTAGDISENGAAGGYAFASQALWQGSSHGAARAAEGNGKSFAERPVIDQGVIAFAQFGANDSETLPINTVLGGGVSAFGIVPGRPQDSFGVGVSTSWLNRRRFERENELMFQTYYQVAVCNEFFLEPAFTYIPTPGASAGLGPAWAFTLRTTVLF